MKRHSILETFLARQYSQGERDSEGVFTLSAEQALSKMAKSTLPFESAWVLKVIQAAVAAEFKAIEVRLLRGCIEMELNGPCPWHPEEVSYLLQVVEAGSTLGLEHLVAALRDRLVEGGRLLLLFQGQQSALYWNGDVLQQQPLEEESARTILSVQTGDPTLGLDFASLSVLSARSAFIGQTITDNAFLCPIPLSVDARRVDQLSYVTQNDNRYGIPVASGWLERPAYQLSLSPRPSDIRVRESLPEALKAYPERLVAGREMSLGVPWVVRAHFQPREVEHDDRVVKVWDPVKGLSTVNFVRDGILVDQDPLWEVPEHVSLHVFLNARELKHDLTGFALVETPEREAASNFAREMAQKVLLEMDRLDLALEETLSETSWGHWFLRLFKRSVEDDRLDSPQIQQSRMQSSYLALRATAGVGLLSP